MTIKMKLNDPQKAEEYFRNKMSFTTGPAEVQDLIERGADINLIDVRAANDFAEGHIKGAVSLPSDKWASTEALDHFSKDKQNVIYCYSAVCHLAARAAVFFSKRGYPVMELDGGMRSWREYEYVLSKSA